MSLRTGLTIVGTAVGAYFGYPGLGFALGSLVGNAVDPTKLPEVVGPRLDNLKYQDSQPGSVIQKLWGTCRVSGQIIWGTDPVEIKKTTDTGGKGGSSQKVTKFNYYQSFAVSLGEGQIDQIRRVWLNSDLVYDVSDENNDSIYEQNGINPYFKFTAKVRSTSNTLLTGTAGDPITIDGIVLTDSDKVLFSNLTSDPNIYYYNQADGVFIKVNDVQNKDNCFILYGTYANKSYKYNSGNFTWIENNKKTLPSSAFLNYKKFNSSSNQKFQLRFYSGTETQMPDPLIELDRGIGKTTAHRGLSYAVFENLNITKWQGIPNITLEIVRSKNNDSVSESFSFISTPEQYPINTNIVYSKISQSFFYASYVANKMYIVEIDKNYNFKISTGIQSYGFLTESLIGVYATLTYLPLQNKLYLKHARFSGDCSYLVFNCDNIDDVYYKVGNVLLANNNDELNKKYYDNFSRRYSENAIDQSFLGGDYIKTFHNENVQRKEPADEYANPAIICQIRSKIYPAYDNDSLFIYQNGDLNFFIYYNYFVSVVESKNEYYGYHLAQQGFDGSTQKLFLTRSFKFNNPVKMFQVGTQNNTFATGIFYDEVNRDVLVFYNELGNDYLLKYNIDDDTQTIINVTNKIKFSNYVRPFSLSFDKFERCFFGSYFDGTNYKIRKYFIDDDTFTDINVITTDLPENEFGIEVGTFVEDLNSYIFQQFGKAGFYFYNKLRVTASKYRVKDIIEEICQEADINVNVDGISVTKEVSGFIINSEATRRQYLEYLCQSYQVESCEDFNLNFVDKEDKNIIEELVYKEDIGAEQKQDVNDFKLILESNRTQELELPQTININFLDQYQDYQQSTQESARQTTLSNKKVSINFPIVFTPDKARQLAEILMYQAWTQRETFKFSTTLKYSHLQPTDLVKIIKPEKTYTLKITKRTDSDNILQFEAVAENLNVYDQQGYTGYSNLDNITYMKQISKTILFPLNIPALTNENRGFGYYMGMCQKNVEPNFLFSGSSLFYSESGDIDSYQNLTNFPSSANVVYGYKLLDYDFIAPFDPFLIDTQSTLYVKLANDDTLNTLSDSDFYDLNFAKKGRNVALIGKEIIKFKNAELIDTKTYKLTHFMRGLFGTERQTNHIENTDQFVILDLSKFQVVLKNNVSYTGYAFIDNNNDGINDLTGSSSSDSDNIQQNIFLRCVSFGDAIENTATNSVSKKQEGLKPYSVINLTGVYNNFKDLVVRFNSRSRGNFDLYQQYIDHDYIDGGTQYIANDQVIELDESTFKINIVSNDNKSFTQTFTDRRGLKEFIFSASLQTQNNMFDKTYYTVRITKIGTSGFESDITETVIYNN